MGWIVTYRGEQQVDVPELDDTFDFAVQYSAWHTADTRTEPGDYEELEDEECYFINGELVEESELPNWVTAAVIDYCKSIAVAVDSSGRRTAD